MSLRGALCLRVLARMTSGMGPLGFARAVAEADGAHRCPALAFAGFRYETRPLEPAEAGFSRMCAVVQNGYFRGAATWHKQFTVRSAIKATFHLMVLKSGKSPESPQKKYLKLFSE